MGRLKGHLKNLGMDIGVRTKAMNFVPAGIDPLRVVKSWGHRPALIADIGCSRWAIVGTWATVTTLRDQEQPDLFHRRRLSRLGRVGSRQEWI